MTTTGNERYWGIVAPAMPAGMIAEAARQQEDMGLLGTFAAQVYGPPWTALAAAATTTTRMQLASGVAQAFVRSPFETAMAAMDLDRISGGRFVLGLGPTVRSWSEGAYGVPGYGRPLAHLREAVEVIRLVIAKSHTGELKHFKGSYYNFDWSEFQGAPPPLRTELPIWLSAVRGPLVELAAEISDGLIGHPIWSVKWATTTVPEHLATGLTRAGKQRSDVHVCTWFWVTPNTDVNESVNDARACVAFYAGVEQYESYFAAHGFGAEARQLQQGVKRGDYRSVAHLVPDEMASTFVVTGTPDEVRRKLEPVWEFADSLLLVPPLLTIEPEKSARYFATIGEHSSLDELRILRSRTAHRDAAGSKANLSGIQRASLRRVDPDVSPVGSSDLNAAGEDRAATNWRTPSHPGPARNAADLGPTPAQHGCHHPPVRQDDWARIRLNRDQRRVRHLGAPSLPTPRRGHRPVLRVGTRPRVTTQTTVKDLLAVGRRHHPSPHHPSCRSAPLPADGRRCARTHQRPGEFAPTTPLTSTDGNG